MMIHFYAKEKSMERRVVGGSDKMEADIKLMNDKSINAEEWKYLGSINPLGLDMSFNALGITFNYKVNSIGISICDYLTTEKVKAS